MHTVSVHAYVISHQICNSCWIRDMFSTKLFIFSVYLHASYPITFYTSLNLIFNNSYFVAKVEIFIKKELLRKHKNLLRTSPKIAMKKDFLLTQIAVEERFTPWTVLVNLIQNHNVYLKMEPVTSDRPFYYSLSNFIYSECI